MSPTATATRPTVLLFDVDGTLITTAGAGRRAIERALEPFGAREHADFSFAGMTDRAIVRRSLEGAGLAADASRIALVLDHYVRVLADEVACAGPDFRANEGMVAALDAAAEHALCAVGLGTGNVERGARIKLERVGLAERFAFGGFGSDAEDRAELLRVGAERGAARLGASLASCRVVVIGDTPKDIAAGRAIGAVCVAVATGPFTREQLAHHTPDRAFESLAEPGAIAALLAG